MCGFPGLIKIFALLCAGSTFAASAHAELRTYQIDSERTVPRFVTVRGSHVIELGRFERSHGTISFDALQETGQVELMIAAESVATGSGILNRLLISPAFLDVRHHAWVRFASTHVAFQQGLPVSIEGMLTIKGVTRPVILNVTDFRQAHHPASGKDAIAGATFTTIRRSDFGLGRYVPLIGDEIRLSIDVEGVVQ